jgi:hypothetical protein
VIHASAYAQIDWTEASDLSDSDKAAIEQLAQNVYMDAIKASVVHHFPSSERSFAIRGQVSGNGVRRVWQELVVCRAGEGYCRTADGNDSKEWSIGKSLLLQERWRFSDGDWFVDVELGTGISYAEAETIVLAIRRKSLQSTPDLETYRNFDVSSIRSIRTTDPLAREYAVEIGGSGSGQSLSVRLQGGDVMLYELAFWRA